MILRLSQHPDGTTTEDGDRVVYDVERDEAHFGAAHVEGHALVWELIERPAAPSVIRCDRVDFPPGGVAHSHTHPGPGLRVLLDGTDPHRDAGRRRTSTARSSGGTRPAPTRCSPRRRETEPTAFVRVLVLPAEWAGKRTIRYVDPADEDKPKLQRARVYFEQQL